MNKYLILLISSLCFLFILACNDPEPTLPEEDMTIKVPDYFIRNGESYLNVDYDSDLRISRYSSHLNEFQFSNNFFEREISLSYNVDELLEHSTFYADGWGNAIEADYFYSGNRLDSIKSSQFGQAEFNLVLNYSSNEICGPLSSEYCQKDEMSNVVNTESQQLAFFDETCQAFRKTTIITPSFAEPDTIIENIQIVYDDEINYWPVREVNFNAKTYSYVLRPTNNIKDYAVENEDGVLQDQSYSSVYEYSGAGQITSEVRTYASGVVDRFEFFYDE